MTLPNLTIKLTFGEEFEIMKFMYVKCHEEWWYQVKYAPGPSNLKL